MGIGPEIPAHLLPSTSASKPAPPPPSKDDEGNDSDASSDYAPDLPPELLSSRQAPSKPIAGPQLPPHLLSSRPSLPEPESEDEDFGPGPLPPPVGASRGDDNDGARAFLEREERQREKERLEKEKGEGKLQREEWMLVPPKEMDLMSSMDPTKLKSRSFQSGPKAQVSTRKGGMNDGPNLWTETPAERQQRLQDEALGKKRKAENAPEEAEETDEVRRKRARDRALKEEVERHNRSSRKETLLDQHSKGKKKGKEGEKEEPQGWDRDRDMSVGGRMMDDGKRKEMIKDAKGLGGRFGSSGFL